MNSIVVLFGKLEFANLVSLAIAILFKFEPMNALLPITLTDLGLSIFSILLL